MKLGITSPEWTKFLSDVKAAKTSLGDPEILWYRGHPNSGHYLLASLLRYENGISREQYLFNSFQKFADRIFKRRDSDWETLFEMQHYGIPTRLLDWTETFSIALFFSASYNQSRHPGKDAAIYVLDPVALNAISGIGRIYRVPSDESQFSYKKIYWHHDPFTPPAPIALEPNFINDRMLAQRGMFTVHHDKIEPLEEQFPKAIKKVILPNDVIPAAIEFLELSNITSYSVYPDFAGLAGYLQDTSGLKSRWP